MQDRRNTTTGFTPGEWDNSRKTDGINSQMWNIIRAVGKNMTQKGISSISRASLSKEINKRVK
jgi:hypothetical protein